MTRLCVCFVSVKRDADTNNEEQLKVKEQAILELGSLLADTKQAEGNTRLYNIKGLNPCTPSVLFVGHMQTVQTQIRCSKMLPLIRVSTVCLQNALL